ncbi:hypothetical protein H9P43_007350 [Blastocladiella emersonii ATCC 22665]|nr:hypothetical protein H9P43_007350 [Blastocladiella emersonii ATCC 22665]
MTRYTQIGGKKTHLAASEFVAKPLLPTKSEQQQQAAQSSKPASAEPPSDAGSGKKQSAAADGAAGKAKGGKHGKGKKRSRSDDNGLDGPVSDIKRFRADRKQQKLDKKKRSTICFHCRQPGHAIKECPSLPSSASSSPTKVGGTDDAPVVPAAAAVKCYLCGSALHTVKGCPSRHSAKRDEHGNLVYPYATCFICNATGHLASQCPKNERGMYPHGGACKFCGSVQHLARDCKPTKPADEGPTVGTVEVDQSPDADDVFVALERMDKEKVASKAIKVAAPVRMVKRVVKF